MQEATRVSMCALHAVAAVVLPSLTSAGSGELEVPLQLHHQIDCEWLCICCAGAAAGTGA
jgi:hypothetical protein